MPLSRARMNERKRQDRVKPMSNLDSGVKPSEPDIPWYNPAIHRTGDTVRVKQYNKVVTVTIPELDADGNRMW